MCWLLGLRRTAAGRVWLAAHRVKEGPGLSIPRIPSSWVAKQHGKQSSSVINHSIAVVSKNSWSSDKISTLQVSERSLHTGQGVQDTKTYLPVNTLEMADKLEDGGFAREQARLLTRHITDVILENTGKVTADCTSAADLDKALLQLEATIAGFKAEVLKTQELHLASLTRDTERLQNESDKIRAELKYEINKLTASQRLDLNLEKGRIRDELSALREKANDIEVRIDKEINALKTSLEASKNDIIRYCVATILSVGLVAVSIMRLLMP